MKFFTPIKIVLYITVPIIIALSLTLGIRIKQINDSNNVPNDSNNVPNDSNNVPNDSSVNSVDPNINIPSGKTSSKDIDLGKCTKNDIRDNNCAGFKQNFLDNIEENFTKVDLVKPPNAIIKKYCPCNACVPPESDTKIGELTNRTCSSKCGKPYVHMCPRMLMGSKPMLDAQILDTKENPNLKNFNYGLVGHDAVGLSLETVDKGLNEKTACGQCYEIHFKELKSDNNEPIKEFNVVDGIIQIPENEKDCPSASADKKSGKLKPLIVQSFNTAAPSGGNYINFDLYMPMGGYGAFNSIYNDETFNNTTRSGSFLYSGQSIINGKSMGSMGGGLRGSMCVTKNKQISSDNDKMPVGNGCFTNGINHCANDDPNDENYYIKQCEKIIGNNEQMTKVSQDSCKWIYKNQYHWNLHIEKVRRVQCPLNLTKVTGLKRIDKNLAIAGSPDSGSLLEEHKFTLSDDPILKKQRRR